MDQNLEKDWEEIVKANEIYQQQILDNQKKLSCLFGIKIKEKKELNMINKNLINEINQLKAELNQKSEENTMLIAQLDSNQEKSKKEIEMLKDEIKRMTTEFDNIKVANEEKDNKIANFTQKLESINETMEKKQEKIEDLKNIIHSLEKNLDDFKLLKIKLEEEILMLKAFKLSFSKKREQQESNELINIDLKILEKQNDAPIKTGTFGSVSKVKHSQSGKIYALKSLNQDISSSNKIDREIILWQTLQSLPEKPSSIPDFHCYLKGDLNFLGGESMHLLFDYFPYSLKNVIDNLKFNKIATPLPFDQIFLYAQKLINGLAFLQTLKICHRDLKPANLLLNENLKEIYIIDLGESKELLSDIPEENKQEMTITGSPKYFSPEVESANNKQEEKTTLNPFKSDVFSFGLIFLELGILEVPSKKDNEFLKQGILKFEKIYENIMKNDDVSQIKLKLFIRILKKCLRINPKSRPDFVDLYYDFQKKFRSIDSNSLRIQIIAGEIDKL